jgi:DNA-cytosine methyltransferase
MKIKLLSLFSGIGAFEKALTNLQIDFEIVNYCEIDKYASAAYSAIHNIPESKNLGDIAKIDIEHIPNFNMMTWGFPCFTADSLVLTEYGYKKIINITIGDKVLSHDNNYHAVTNTFENGIHNIYKINAMGSDEIKTTSNHKFLIREKYRKGHKSIRCFREPQWKETKDLTKNDYLGIAINQKSVIPQISNLPVNEKNFWWFIGRYLGDGWQRHQGGVIVCCAKDELNEILPKIEGMFHYNVVEERTVYKIHIPIKRLGEFVSQFGKDASNKHLTNTILDLPTDLLEPFLEGYISADGCFAKGVYKVASTSRELTYGIAQCVAKVYHTPYRIYKISTPNTTIIEGRVVNQRDWYQLAYKHEAKKQDKAFYEDGYIWTPINKIEPIGKDYVYDIEVETTHSFTVQNTIVHNCQDISVAGHQKGIHKGTRSGLYYEAYKILEYHKPKYSIIENVKNLTGKKHIKQFEMILEDLSKLGYTNYYKVLNAKDYGVPQSRERVFIVSILGGEHFYFPEMFDNGIRLKDLLEDKVDERFYIDDSKTEKLLSELNTKEGTVPCLTPDRIKKRQNGRRFKENNDPMFSLTCQDIHGVAIDDMSKMREISYCIDANYYKGTTLDGYVNKKRRQLFMENNPKCIGRIDVEGHDYLKRVYSENGISPTIGTCQGGNQQPKTVSNYRIRKLTPKECWRLMGFSDTDYEVARTVLNDTFYNGNDRSSSQLYKMAGNSIVVDVLYYIFKNLLTKVENPDIFFDV